MSVFTAAGGAAGAGPLPPEPSAAPPPREDTAPETPGLPEDRAKGSAGAEGLRGSREWGGGGYSQSPVVPPGLCLALGPCLALQGVSLGKRLLSAAVPAPGQGCPAHEEVFGLALCRSVPRQITVSIPCRARSGVAAACVWLLPCPWHVGSCCCCPHPVRHFPPFVCPRMCSGSPAAWDLLVPTATVPATLSQCDHVSPLVAPSPSRAATFPIFPSPCCCLWPSECPFWVGFSCFALGFAVLPHQQWAVRL